MSEIDEDTFPCPNCGEDCENGDEKCPSCGADLSDYYDEDGEEPTPESKRDLWELDEESEKKLGKIINKCVERIACECDYYDTEAIEDDDNEDVVDSVLDNFLDNNDADDLIAFIDTSSEEKGETGLLFTKIGIVEKGDGYKIVLPYKKMSDLSMDDGKLIFLHTRGCGTGSQKDKDVYIKETYYDLDMLMTLCEKIVNYLDA